MRQRRRPNEWLDRVADRLLRAYYERPNAGSFKVPIHRTVVRVEKDRVYYRTQDGGRVRSCSKATWRRLDAALAARAAQKT